MKDNKTNYTPPDWGKVKKLLSTDSYYFSPSQKDFMRDVYEYFETNTLDDMEFVIDVIKPLHLKECNKTRPHRYEIISTHKKKDSNITDVQRKV